MQGREVGSWQLESKLGEGGMGRVYLARHKVLGTLAAVKSLPALLAQDSSFRERFFQEARAQAQLSHPHIVEVKDFVIHDEEIFMISEYMPGGSLADLIDEADGPLDMDQALSWAMQALAALDFAHQKGVIHRDVKPSNIMLDAEGVAKVTDFGIALIVGGRRVTTTGTTLGTPNYMSPEQIARPKEMDHRSDVYSMGVVLYEMLTGQVPFDGDTDFNIKLAQVNEPPKSLRELNPGIPTELDEIVLAALAKSADDRFSGCGMFARTIGLFRQGEPHRGSMPGADSRTSGPKPAESIDAVVRETETQTDSQDLAKPETRPSEAGAPVPSSGRKPSYWNALLLHLCLGFGFFYLDKKVARKWIYPMLPVYAMVDFMLGPKLGMEPFRGEFGFYTFLAALGLFAISFIDLLVTCHLRRRRHSL